MHNSDYYYWDHHAGMAAGVLNKPMDLLIIHVPVCCVLEVFRGHVES